MGAEHPDCHAAGQPTRSLEARGSRGATRIHRRPPLRRDGGRLGRIRGPGDRPPLPVPCGERREPLGRGQAAGRARGQPERPRERRAAAAAPPEEAEAAASSSSSSSSSSDDDDERGISDDEFDDPDLEAKFRRMLETPEGREAVDAEARAGRAVGGSARARALRARRRRRRRRQSGGGGFLSTLATLATLPLKVPFGVIRWGWNRWRRPEAAGDGSDVV